MFFIKSSNLAPAVLLCIESPGGKLEGVPSRRLSGRLIVNAGLTFENVTLMLQRLSHLLSVAAEETLVDVGDPGLGEVGVRSTVEVPLL